MAKPGLFYELNKEQRDLLRKIITDAGLTQTALAEQLSVTRSCMNQYISGRTRLSQENATKLYALLGGPTDLSFLCNLQETTLPTGSLSSAYVRLRDAYVATLKTSFEAQPNNRKLEILADLDALVKKYETR